MGKDCPKTICFSLARIPKVCTESYDNVCILVKNMSWFNIWHLRESYLLQRERTLKKFMVVIPHEVTILPAIRNRRLNLWYITVRARIDCAKDLQSLVNKYYQDLPVTFRLHSWVDQRWGKSFPFILAKLGSKWAMLVGNFIVLNMGFIRMDKCLQMIALELRTTPSILFSQKRVQVLFSQKQIQVGGIRILQLYS